MINSGYGRDVRPWDNSQIDCSSAPDRSRRQDEQSSPHSEPGSLNYDMNFCMEGMRNMMPTRDGIRYGEQAQRSPDSADSEADLDLHNTGFLAANDADLDQQNYDLDPHNTAFLVANDDIDQTGYSVDNDDNLGPRNDEDLLNTAFMEANNDMDLFNTPFFGYNGHGFK